MILGLLSVAIAMAAPIFSTSPHVSVNPEWREDAPPFRPLGDARYEILIRFTALDASGKPSFTNETQQRVRWKKAEKSEKFELLYEDYRTSSLVQVLPGMAPMKTNQDFGVYLSSKPLKIFLEDGKPKRIENIEAVREQLNREVKDGAANQALRLTFQENILLDTLRSYLQEKSCLPGASGKAVGSAWSVSFAAPETTAQSSCRLEGWGEVAGRRVLVISFTVAKAVQETKLPMGGMATVETEGSGRIYFEPKSGESWQEVDMNISQLSGAAKGNSKMSSSAHAMAL